MPYLNRDKQREYQRIRVAAARNFFLKNKNCVNCGSTQNLEVDHIDRSTKLSHRIWSWSERKRIRELEKCQVLCKPCHSKKTKQERELLRTIPPHGTEARYDTDKCRCQLCVSMKSAIRQARRATKH